MSSWYAEQTLKELQKEVNTNMFWFQHWSKEYETAMKDHRLGYALECFNKAEHFHETALQIKRTLNAHGGFTEINVGYQSDINLAHS